MASVDDFLKLDIRVGTVISASVHPTAKKPSYQLEIDFGSLGIKCSSAQITKLYQPEDLLQKQVIAVVNFPPRRIGGFVSEVLVLGAMGSDGDIIVLTTERPAADGDVIA